MNECVKTGVVFSFADSKDVLRTGDLFYHAGSFCLKGVPRGTWTEADNYRPRQILLTPGTLVERGNCTYSDTEYGLQILEATPDFVEHMEKWYPDLKEMLP